MGDISVIDGAAMALPYDARRATRDIDAVFRPHGIVLEEAHALADELGLPRWWLIEQACVDVVPGGDPDSPVTFDHPGLRVARAVWEQLTAAGRQRWEGPQAYVTPLRHRAGKSWDF